MAGAPTATAVSLAGQSVTELGGPLSVLARQRADHVELDRLLSLLSRTPAAEQRPVLVRLHRLVFPHAFAEESVLWPTLRRVLPDGEQLTLQVEQEHHPVVARRPPGNVLAALPLSLLDRLRDRVENTPRRRCAARRCRDPV